MLSQNRHGKKRERQRNMYQIERIVASSDCDQTSIQSAVSIVTMMQDCSGLWIESEPIVWDWMKANDFALVITSRQLDILRRPAYMERLTVRTSVYQFKGPLGFRNTIIYDAKDKPVAVSWCTGPFIDLRAGKLARPPKDVAASMTIDPKFEMEYLPRKIALPDASAFAEHEPVDVMPSDIDYYHHVNNAQYVRMACDILPRDYAWNRLRIEYKSQAKLDAQIHPKTCKTDDAYFVVLEDDAGKPYAELEFSTY